MKLTCKLPLLKPSLPIILAGQGRNCIHALDFKCSPYTTLFVLFLHLHSEALLLMLIYCKAEKARENYLQSK